MVMNKIMVYISLLVVILSISCMSTKSLEGPEGVIEYEGEVDMPSVEEDAVTEVVDVSEGSSVVESIVADEPSPTEEFLVEDEPFSTEASKFVEMTKEEKKDTLEKSPDAEDVNYIYSPEKESENAKIGGVEIPKWFAYLCFGVILATLATMCYIANQNKKKMYYYGRRD